MSHSGWRVRGLSRESRVASPEPTEDDSLLATRDSRGASKETFPPPLGEEGSTPGADEEGIEFGGKSPSPPFGRYSPQKGEKNTQVSHRSFPPLLGEETAAKPLTEGAIGRRDDSRLATRDSRLS